MIYNTWRKRLALTQSQIYDFYALSTVLDLLDEQDKTIAFQVLQEVKKDYIESLTKAVNDEFRHAKDYVEGEWRYIQKTLNVSDNIAKQISLGQPLDLETMYRAFNELDWEDEYGGPKWAEITKLLIDLANTPVEDYKNFMVIVDRINDIEHNTGSIFTKFKKHQEYKWIEQVLDLKYAARSPYTYYNMLSPEVKRIMSKYRGLTTKEHGYIEDTKKWSDVLDKIANTPLSIISNIVDNDLENDLENEYFDYIRRLPQPIFAKFYEFVINSKKIDWLAAVYFFASTAQQKQIIDLLLEDKSGKQIVDFLQFGKGLYNMINYLSKSSLRYIIKKLREYGKQAEDSLGYLEKTYGV
jgi:hypothetical protein